jgi:non-lysosomal glucosylceramidase
VQGLLKSPGVTIFTHQGIAVPSYPESADLPGVGGSFTLTPGQKQRFVFFYAWYFPNLSVDGGLVGRHYQTRFQDAQEVATEVASRYDELAIATKEWVDNWNNSSLPHWFLDRSLIALDTLATESSYRFANGRVWSWEGVGAGPGTCIHVWHYAQSNAHLFPAFSRNLREVTDFSISQDKATGGIAMRAEDDRTVPTDGQAGVILEAWREHRSSADDEFLRRNWPGIREAISYLIEHDTDNDGFIDGPQPVTEDAAWYGKMPFIATLYQAALRASEEMAGEVGDPAFASQCHDLYKKSRAAMSSLFNGEFFVQELDPAFQDIVATGPGSFIDQLLGQWWAFQTGLGQITDPSQVKKAMQSLWHYNYTTDVGPFRRQFTSGRTYALDKEAALVMCTWPNGGYRPAWATQWSSEYFNENWTGQEHAAAATMVYAGLLEEGLAVMRSVHDRYHPAKRNPFSEIEYSDHYSRAMSSYSVYLAITGFSYHGPKAEIAFAPKLGADNFQCAFTAPEGWGSFKQQTNGNVREITLTVRCGTLRLNRFSLQNPPSSAARVTLLRSQVNGKVAPATQVPAESGSQVNLQFSPTLVLQKGESLSLYLTT